MVTQGIFTTLYVSAISIVIASFIAIIGAVAKMSSNGFAYAIASFYTSFFRGLPLLMQVYLIYLGFPQIGYVIDAVPAGIIALSLCYGAYMTEIFRAGIMSIDAWPVGGITCAGFQIWSDYAQDNFAPVYSFNYSTHWKPIYCDAQRQLTGIRHWCLGTDVSRPHLGQ